MIMSGSGLSPIVDLDFEHRCSYKSTSMGGGTAETTAVDVEVDVFKKPMGTKRDL